MKAWLGGLQQRPNALKPWRLRWPIHNVLRLDKAANGPAEPDRRCMKVQETYDDLV